MNKGHNPQFEATNLLTINQGTLAITIIPAVDEIDWVVPTQLILESIPYDKRIKSYTWQGTTIPVHPLLNKSAGPNTLIILEGASDEQRLGLLVKGVLTEQRINISDIKDIEPDSKLQPAKPSDYVFQFVAINKHIYLVPDLLKLVNQLTKQST